MAAIADRGTRGRLTAQIIETRRPVVLDDIRPGAYMRWAIDLGLRSLVGIPLESERGVIGALVVAHATPGALRDEHVRRLEMLSAHTAAALSRAQAFEEVERLAVTDGLTGLANARAFWQRLAEEVARARRYTRPLALVILDSDSLKMVNDRFGHQEGDRHLLRVTEKMRAAVRGTDIIARFGGDEFVVLQPETDLSAATATAVRIHRAIQDDAFASSAGERIPATVSVGVAASPGSVDDPEELFRSADAALYDAKRAGKDRVVVSPPRRDSSPPSPAPA